MAVPLNESQGVSVSHPNGYPTSVEGWDWRVWFASRVPDPALLLAPAGRRALTRTDPLLWALVYFRHSLTDDATASISFADMHIDMCRRALNWMKPPIEPKAAREADIAPRGAGKSTWRYKILLLWAAAHGYSKFVATFASASGQASKWLGNLKKELETNELLRLDYPDLCSPAIRELTGRAMRDTDKMYQSKSGWTITAVGMDSNVLGLNIDDMRPDMILFDDIEPGEGTYSEYQMEKRLTDVKDVAMAMEPRARVQFVGTVTMVGSIFHQFIKYFDQPNPKSWISEEKIQVHWYKPLVPAFDGSERSFWPGKWATSYLLELKGTRDYAKNWYNDPMPIDGTYWRPEDFIYRTMPDSMRDMAILSIDPAITSKRRSDTTGFAIVSYSYKLNAFEVSYARGLRLTPEGIRDHALALIATHPYVTSVLIEVNQGGDVWKSLFKGFPVPLVSVTQHLPKETRAARGLALYQPPQRRVWHAGRLPDLEAQMCAFPRGAYDDMVDAVSTPLVEVTARLADERKTTSSTYRRR